MAGKVLSHDAWTGVTQVFHHDANAGRNIIEHIQDIDPFVAESAARAKGLNKKEQMWYVGTIPDAVILQWAEECKCRPYSRGWRRYAAKQLNKREYRKFNVNNIRLGTKGL